MTKALYYGPGLFPSHIPSHVLITYRKVCFLIILGQKHKLQGLECRQLVPHITTISFLRPIWFWGRAETLFLDTSWSFKKTGGDVPETPELKKSFLPLVSAVLSFQLWSLNRQLLFHTLRSLHNISITLIGDEQHVHSKACSRKIREAVEIK